MKRDDGAEANSSVEKRMIDFAEDLGRLLGTAQRKADAWLGERKQISEQLHSIRNTATQLLGQLGEQIAETAEAVRRGHQQQTAAPRAAKPSAKSAKPAKGRKATRRTRKGGRVVSEETRAKMRAAWARRKAENDSSRS